MRIYEDFFFFSFLSLKDLDAGHKIWRLARWGWGWGQEICHCIPSLPPFFFFFFFITRTGPKRL